MRARLVRPRPRIDAVPLLGDDPCHFDVAAVPWYRLLVRARHSELREI